MFLQSVEHVHWSDSKQSIMLSEHSHVAHVPTAPLDVNSLNLIQVFPLLIPLIIPLIMPLVMRLIPLIILLFMPLVMLFMMPLSAAEC